MKSFLAAIFLALTLILTFIAGESVTAQRRRQPPAPRPTPRPTPRATPTPDPNIVSVDEAERRLNAHIKTIDQRASEMVAAYYFTGGQRTLEISFRKAGVTGAMSYADSWGKAGLGLFWSEYVKGFYDYHRDILNKSIFNVQKRSYVKKSELEYIDKSMEGWKQYELSMAKQFEKLVDRYTLLAMNYDQQEAAQLVYNQEMGRAYEAKDMNRYDAVKAERARVGAQYDEKTRQLGEQLNIVKDQIAKQAQQHLFTPIEYEAGCLNGTERLRIDQKQTRKWVLAESIDFTKASAAYLATDKNVLKTLSTAKEVIDWLTGASKVVRVPPPGNIALKYFKEIIKDGNEIVQAAGRISEREKNKYVDLTIRINLIEVTVDCAAVEVCENGHWVRKGFKQVGAPTQQKLAPLIKPEPAIHAGDMWQKIDYQIRHYAKLQENYEADPCSGTNAPAEETTPQPNPECDKLKARIDELEEQKKSIEREGQDARQELDHADSELTKWKQGLKEHKESLTKAWVAAGKDLEAAEKKLGTAKLHLKNLESNPNAPTAGEWTKNLTKAKEDLKTATDRKEAAEKNVAAAKERLDNIDKTTAQREGDVARAKEKIEEIPKRLADAQNEINRLQQQYNACKR